jgi:hypothetical protein
MQVNATHSVNAEYMSADRAETPPQPSSLIPQPSPSALFPQANGESERAFEAFLAYWELGPRRRYSVVARKVGVCLRTVKGWASLFDWRGRIKARAAECAEQSFQTEAAVHREELLDAAARAKAWRERQYDLAEAMLDTAERYLENLDEDPDQMSFADACRALQIASRLGQEALGGPGEEAANAAKSLHDQLATLLDQDYGDAPTPAPDGSPGPSDGRGVRGEGSVMVPQPWTLVLPAARRQTRCKKGQKGAKWCKKVQNSAIGSIFAPQPSSLIAQPYFSRRAPKTGAKTRQNPPNRVSDSGFPSLFSFPLSRFLAFRLRFPALDCPSNLDPHPFSAPHPSSLNPISPGARPEHGVKKGQIVPSPQAGRLREGAAAPQQPLLGLVYLACLAGHKSWFAWETRFPVKFWSSFGQGS